MGIHYKEVTDSELIRHFKKKRDPECIGELFTRYSHLVYGVCLKHLKNEDDAKDAVMQIVEKLFTDLQKHDVANFKGWLHSVAKNHCLMDLRKQRSGAWQKEVPIENIPAEFMDSFYFMHQDNNIDTEEKVRHLLDGLQILKKEQKTCIELLYLQQKSYREVMEETGYSMKQVKSYIQNGKRNLGIYLSNIE